jgi:hypothetical protein
MTIVIDGTNGISGVDGTAASPALEGSDSNTGMYFPAADRIGFSTNGTQRGEFDANGNFLFNSGFGSVATAYGCRAWVNFNGTANTNLTGTYSQSGTTVTVTATAHGLIAGNNIYSDITTGTAVDGIYTVATVTDANTFTYTAGTSLTTSGNITLIRSTIRASGNVSSITDNGTGEYTVNFTTALPDANYSINVNANMNYGATLITSPSLNTQGGGASELAPSTTSFRFYIALTTSAAFDPKYVNVSIFR